MSQPGNQHKQYESVYGHLQTQERPCFRCGKPAKRRISPEDQGHYKVFCNTCKSHLDKYPDAMATHCESNHPIEQFARSMMINYGAGPVTVYRPGDPEFEKIAAECDLQPRQKQPFYNAFEGRNYHDRKR